MWHHAYTQLFVSVFRQQLICKYKKFWENDGYVGMDMYLFMLVSYITSSTVSVTHMTVAF